MKIKRLFCLITALILLLSVAPVSPVSAAEVPPEVGTSTLVWDMEDLPEKFDGIVTSLFTELWGSEDGYALGNVKISVAPGKGYDGSTAMAWTLHNHAFGNNLYVEYAGMEGAITNWTGATEVIFYIDASEIGEDMPVDLMMNHTGEQYGMVINAAWYTYSDGQWVTHAINEWGHMVVPANYVGWIRVPLATMGAQPDNMAQVNRLCFYTEHHVVDGTVYFDHIMINASNTNVEPPKAEIPDEVKYAKLVLDMEDLPADFDDVMAGVFSENGGTGYEKGYFVPSIAAGKGVDGSTALGWNMTANHWTNMTYMAFDDMAGAVTDWTGATEMYFYLDASEIAADVILDVILDRSVGGHIEGTSVYYWNGSEWKASEINVWGHMILPAKFCGWIRVPFSTLATPPSDLSEVTRIAFALEHYDSTGGMIYIDNFMINAKDTEPPVDAPFYTNGRPIKLYPSKKEAPYNDGVSAATRTNPTITPYIRDGADQDMAVIVCPGGGYWGLSMVDEGSKVAEALNGLGVSAFVLTYRTAANGVDYRAILTDLFRSIRYVRYHAEEFGIDPNKIVVAGFSAGGHLAAMSLEHFDGEFATLNIDEADQVSSKPNGGIICYGVGSFTDPALIHQGSLENFLGAEKNNTELREKYSSELGVREDMPPAYIWHHLGDTDVPTGNSQKLSDAMTALGIANKLHFFEGGWHGGGLWVGQPAQVWLKESVDFFNEQFSKAPVDPEPPVDDPEPTDPEPTEPQETEPAEVPTEPADQNPAEKPANDNSVIIIVIAVVIVLAAAVGAFFILKKK